AAVTGQSGPGAGSPQSEDLSQNRGLAVSRRQVEARPSIQASSVMSDISQRSCREHVLDVVGLSGSARSHLSTRSLIETSKLLALSSRAPARCERVARRLSRFPADAASRHATLPA